MKRAVLKFLTIISIMVIIILGNTSLATVSEIEPIKEELQENFVTVGATMPTEFENAVKEIENSNISTYILIAIVSAIVVTAIIVTVIIRKKKTKNK